MYTFFSPEELANCGIGFALRSIVLKSVNVHLLSDFLMWSLQEERDISFYNPY